MREEFVEIWENAQAISPKLEFNNLVILDVGPEAYLKVIKIAEADTRKSFRRLRISCQNLYIERGRYETLLVPLGRSIKAGSCSSKIDFNNFNYLKSNSSTALKFENLINAAPTMRLSCVSCSANIMIISNMKLRKINVRAPAAGFS